MNILLESLFPVFAIIALGGILRRLNFTNDEFLKTSDRLVYFILFPAMLFWKIGGSDPSRSLHWPLVFAMLTAVFLVWLVVIVYASAFRVERFDVGSLAQCSYRFNTYVGMAIIYATIGEPGIRLFGVAIGFLIPFINVLCVSTLIWYSGEHHQPLATKLPFILRSMISNPLILACLAGLFYSRLGIPLPSFVDRFFSLLSLLTLPLALLSVGGSLNLGKLGSNFRQSLAAGLFKLVVLPLLGFACLRIFNVTGTAFQVGMIYFALPTSTAAYVLSSQLKSNTDLAAAAIALSTMASFASLALVLLLYVG